MRYLYALGYDPLASLDMVQAALERAMRSRKGRSNGAHAVNPVAATMRALRIILTAQARIEKGQGTHSTWDILQPGKMPNCMPADSAAADRDTDTAAESWALPTSPPIRRGRMVPEKMVRFSIKRLVAFLLHRVD